MPVCQPFWYFPTPTPSTSSAMKTLENTEEDYDDPEPVFKWNTVGSHFMKVCFMMIHFHDPC